MPNSDSGDYTYTPPPPVNCDVFTPRPTDAEPWPDIASRQIVDILERLRRLEVQVHRLINASEDSR